uniref:ATP-binding protein n=1 Tax=Butyricicoccus sp. TaxID=2049021 RepID=UPI003D7DB78E
GRLLWRVLDNLISNCVRYAVPHSRVYVDITQTDTMCVLTMKNISAVELNISAEELMQRFTRGDRSRHTEGSGLGLSIAQSLAELMHGSCRVEIDGDLFKAIVEIPRWTQPETNKPN